MLNNIVNTVVNSTDKFGSLTQHPMRQLRESAKPEDLIPVIRARLATRMAREGFRVRQIASALNITPAAVVQYIQGKRGRFSSRASQDRTIDALADKVMQRMKAGTGDGLRMAELIEAAEQMLIVGRGSGVLEETSRGRDSKVVEILRQRLQLEMKASERCLESAMRFDDQYAKLLLRMIAGDSMRHADVVSQILSWIEISQEPVTNLPKKEFLDAILQIEDKAAEVSLKDTVKISHPVARLLLEWIDNDEKKHERIIGKMANLIRQGTI